MLHLLRERALVPVATAVRDTQQLVRQARDTATDLVGSAMNFLGVPYKRGGNSPEFGFDCSGFTRHIFENTLGLVLPHRAEQQANGAGLSAVPREHLEPGDLVFFNTMRRAFSHVGIYIGDGKFIHAPRSGAEVRVEDMSQSYWAKRFNGARRVEAPATASARP
jgi:cell wall-associated NlpC family hydrolase